MNKESLSLLPVHQAKALLDHYVEYGVGDTDAQRKNHWNMFYPNTNIYHADTDEKIVAVFELTFLTDMFPAEFHYC